MGRKAHVIPMSVHQQLIDRAIMVAKQILWDAVSITLNNKHGFGEKRMTELQAAVEETDFEIAKLIKTDSKDLEYAKAKIDGKLKEIYGDKFEPWEVRYGK